MPRPEYHDPQRLEEVTSLLERYGDDAKLVAGGQSLMVMLRQGIIAPAALIDLARVPGLVGVSSSDGELQVGAMTTMHAIERDALIGRHAPVLAQAAAAVGPFQIRNMGTIGGNASHNAVGADPPPALLALEARAVIHGPGGDRSLPLDEFFTGYFETALRPDEVVTAFRFTKPAAGTTGAYLKFASRAVDMALVSVAVVLRPDDDRLRDVRIAIGGAAPVPFRARDAEAHLLSAGWNEGARREAGRLAARAAAPLGDVHASAPYRRWLVSVLVPRALVEADRHTRERGAA
jgi:aerobic carbon-monoxide dehydrogenase medium subunit